MAIQTYTFEDLWKRVSEYLGTGLAPKGDDLVRAQDIVNAGLLRFLGSREWTFLKHVATLSLVANDEEKDMPADFERFIQPPTFDETYNYPPLQEVSVSQIHSYRSGRTYTSSPQYFALNNKTHVAASGTEIEIMLFPKSDATYALEYEYKSGSTSLTSKDHIPIGGRMYSLAIQKCCLAEAEEGEDEIIEGPQFNAAQREVGKAIKQDIHREPSSLGYVYGGAARPLRRSDVPRTVSYDNS